LAGISLLEYAALKQNSVVALAAVGVHGTIGWWRARRTYQGFARFGLFLTELPLRLLIVGTSAFVVAYPIVAGLGHGDRAFFDGRPISVALERVAQPVTWHELSRGFLLHWRVLTEPNGDTFHTGSVDFPVLNALWFLLLPVLASLVSILNRLRPPAGRVDVRPTLALACIGILSSLYCVVFYRETSFGGYRFLFLVPPLVFASLHCAGAVYFILNSLFSHSRIFRYLQAMSALAVLYIAFENHQQFITYLHAPSTRAAYKSKLSELCPALEALPPSTRVAFVSPLLGNEVFFGDTAVDHWVQKPSEFGYDSVHCRYADPIPFIKTPRGVKQVVETPWIEPHDSKNFDILVFQARYRDASELMHDDHGTILTQRLHEAFNELEAAAGDVQIERSRCSSVAGSAWYRFALCPLRR
jgi:hypothetical protein